MLRYKGFPLSANEEQAMNELSQIATQPDNPEQLHKKMLVLWSQLQHIIAQRMTGANGKAEIWRTVSDEDTNMIAKVNRIDVESCNFLLKSSVLSSGFRG